MSLPLELPETECACAKLAAKNGQRAGWLSRKFDLCLPKRFRQDGNEEFANLVVPSYLRPNMTVYDVGGGKTPFLNPATKQRLRMRVVGLDIDAKELNRAPQGSYDEVVYADVCDYAGRSDADLIVCRTLLEHVPDAFRAIESVAATLKPGGTALIFVPSRNALFARLNLLLPQRIKHWLLKKIYPHAAPTQGFPAFYDRCTPRQFRLLSGQAGLLVEEERIYFSSGYFSCLLPVYVIWRIWQLAFYMLRGSQAAETFTLVLRKPASTISRRKSAKQVADAVA